jgi:putative endonuclease
MTVFGGLMHEEIIPAVYILASKRNGTLYVGVTGNLWSRVATHKDEGLQGFTQKYKVKLLVWYEFHNDMTTAITREKQIKDWKRDWKIKMIVGHNQTWQDLHDEIDYSRNYQPKNLK